MSKDDDEMPEETFQLADEFLLIVIGVVCERMSVDISDISAKDEMQYRLIHLLLSAGPTYFLSFLIQITLLD